MDKTTTRKVQSMDRKKKDDSATKQCQPKPNKDKSVSNKDKSLAAPAKKAQEVSRDQRNKRRRQSTVLLAVLIHNFLL